MASDSPQGQGVLSELLESLASVGPPLVEALEGLTPLFASLGEGLAVAAPEVFAVGAALAEMPAALQEVADFVQPIVESLGKALGGIAEGIAAVVDPAFKALASVLSPVLEAIEHLGGALKTVGIALGAVVALANPLGVVSSGLSALGSALNSALSAIASGIKHFVSALGSAVGEVASRLKDLASGIVSQALVPLVSHVVSAGKTLADWAFSLEKANVLMRGAAGVLRSFTSSLTGGLETIASAITPFVQALNPNLVYGLNYALRSVSATIGVAFTPAAEALSRAAKQIAGILMPAMQAIAPVLGSLADALMTFAQGTFRVFADTIEAFAPVLQFLADASHAVVSAFDAVRAVLMAAIDTVLSALKGLFGGTGDFKDVLKQFRDMLHQTTAALLRFAVMLSKELGFGEFQKNLRDSLLKIAGAEKPKQHGAAPAPGEVGFKSFEDIAKTMAVAAFAAQGGGEAAAEAKSEREWLKELADSLNEIKEGKSIKDSITEALSSGLDGLIRKLKAERKEWSDWFEEWYDRKKKEWKEYIDASVIAPFWSAYDTRFNRAMRQVGKWFKAVGYAMAGPVGWIAAYFDDWSD